MSALRFIGIDPDSQQGNCPTVWVDDETKDLVIQGWKADSATTDQALSFGAIPDHEAVIRVPARMAEIIRKACDDSGSANV